MMPALIDARDLDDAYFTLVQQCYENGYKYEITEGSNKGGFRLEFPFAAGWIEYPHTRPLAPVMPDGIPPVTTDDKIQEYFVNYLMDEHLEENEEYRYSTWINGQLLNPATKTLETQLAWCIRHLQEKGFGNNHCYITVGTPEINFNYDYPYSNETERRTSPCLRGIDIKVKSNKVILGVVYRSWDLFAGFPENMGGFTLLNQYVADMLGIHHGPVTFASQGLHIYDYQAEAVLGYLRKEE
jgi:thymidylate synthase